MKSNNRETLLALSVNRLTSNKLFVSKRVFSIEKSLGDGATSIVLQGRYQKGNEKLRRKVAIKLFKQEYTTSQACRRMLVNEISILQSLDHPNIVKLHEILLQRTRIGKTFVKGIVFEHCDMGDLYSYLSISTGYKLSSLFVRAVFQQLVRAIAFLHANGIVHNDIKPENVLLKSNGLVLLTDFGFAQKAKVVPYDEVEKISTASSETAASIQEKHKIPVRSLERAVLHKSFNGSASNLLRSQLLTRDISRSKSHTGISSLPKELRVSSTCGTPEYRAPEALLCSSSHEFDGAAADMYGLGVLLFVLLFGRFPSKGERPANNESREREKRMLFGNLQTDSWGHSFESIPTSISVTNGFFRSELIDSANSVCNNLMQLNPSDRVKSADLLYHPYVEAHTTTGSISVIRQELKKLRYYRK